MKFFIPLLLASACLAIPQDLAKPDFSPVKTAIIDSRADIETRARCVPGSYGKKKKSCTPHCKGRGKCSRASSPGIGFIWVCTCPSARRDTFENPSGLEDLAKRIAEPDPEPIAPAEDTILEVRNDAEA